MRDPNDTIAWVILGFPHAWPVDPYDPCVAACQRVRDVAACEGASGIIITDPHPGDNGDLRVAVRGPVQELWKWLARVMCAVAGPIMAAGAESFGVSHMGEQRWAHKWGYSAFLDALTGRAQDASKGLVEFVRAGEFTEQLVSFLAPHEPQAWASMPPATGALHFGLSVLDVRGSVLRAGLPRVTDPPHGFLPMYSVALAQAALALADVLPPGYAVEETPWIVCDGRGEPRATIFWGNTRTLHKAHGRRDPMWSSIDSTSYHPVQGHVVAQTNQPAPFLGSTGLRPWVRLPLPPETRIAMIDSSVAWSVRGANFPGDVLMLFHTLTAADIALADIRPDPVTLANQPWEAGPKFFQSGSLLEDLPYEPIAPTMWEFKNANMFMMDEANLARDQGREPQLTRSDAVGLAMAIDMGLPLMTRVPELYREVLKVHGYRAEPVEFIEWRD